MRVAKLRFPSKYPNIITEITRGSTEKWTLNFTLNGAAVNITGYKFYLAISSALDGSTPDVIELVITPSAPTIGQAVITMTDSQTLAITTPGRYFYSLKYSKPIGDGELYTFDQGECEVFQCVNPRVKLVENSPSASPSGSPSGSPSATPSSSPS